MRWFRVVLIASLSLIIASIACQPAPFAQLSQTDGGGNYLFCFWNVENLFDDHYDQRPAPADREFDAWFADHPEILKLKLEKLSDALLKLNEGKGPDILALAEVESRRAGELLQKTLNDRLKEPAFHYTNLLMKEVAGGRHIATAILTRLPVVGNRTRLHGRRQRILEGHVNVAGQDLTILASHWTSRLRRDSDRGRDDYGNQLYGLFRAMYTSNPAVDFLVCGDFNDTPDDASVTENLHATGNSEAVLQGQGPPSLYNLMAGKSPTGGFGTHYYKRWFIFDQIVVSPGLLDVSGWSCIPGSVRTINGLYRPGDRHHRPWRFGGERERGERGYSDHFPVVVRLTVRG
jgi:endonuclease/exonuclease/phosphatase family metal-dependent hydrolase